MAKYAKPMHKTSHIYGAAKKGGKGGEGGPSVHTHVRVSPIVTGGGRGKRGGGCSKNKRIEGRILFVSFMYIIDWLSDLIAYLID